MIPAMPEDREGAAPNIQPKHIGALAIIIAFGGIIAAFLTAQGFLPGNPSMTLGMALLVSMIVVCCGSSCMMTSYASKTVEYGEMEIRYKEAKEYYDNEEWEKALPIFIELAGPKKDHKRAAYYAAKSYENLDDWENVKFWCKAYLELKPKDREVWELLSTAHKRLFEYEDAQIAADKASAL